MSNFITEFKEFALKGNVMDLAVGVIIGGAFGKIVSSIVADVIMPLIGLLLGTLKFTDLKIGPVMIGNFLQATIDFLIIAVSIFLVIKTINRFGKKPAPAAVTKPE